MRFVTVERIYINIVRFTAISMHNVKLTDDGSENISIR